MDMSWTLDVGVVQMCATDDLAKNLATCRELAGGAKARLVVLPECFPFLGRGEGDKLAIAETLDGDGPIMTMLREVARAGDCYVVGGGMPERVPGDAKRTYNTAVVIGPGGELIARYRKIHLFDIDIPGKVLHESDGTRAGELDDLVVVDIDGAKVGLSICYDVRFPELYRTLVKDRGAEVILVPAAFTAHTGAAHWELLLRARAVENQTYVVAAAQWGQHNEKRASFGHAMVVDPWGTIVDSRPSGDGMSVVKLRGDVVEQRRTQMPVLSHAVLWGR